MRPTIVLLFLIFSLLLGIEANAEVYSFKDSQHLLEEAYTPQSFELGSPDKNKRFDYFEGTHQLIENASQDSLLYDFHFYLPKELKYANLIVLTPNIDGVTILETGLAKFLAKKGFPVVVPLERSQVITFDEGTAFRMERQVRRAMAGTFHLIKALKTRFPNINTDSMGVAGASLGGIRSSILFGLDSRFKAAFIAVAGSDIPLLYETTRLESLVNFRNQHMEYLGLSHVRDYSNYLRKFLFLEPNLITRSMYLENVAMIISNNDDTVPTLNQWRLFSRIKEAGVHPKTFITESGHILGASELLFRRNTVYRWFKERL